MRSKVYAPDLGIELPRKPDWIGHMADPIGQIWESGSHPETLISLFLVGSCVTS